MPQAEDRDETLTSNNRVRNYDSSTTSAETVNSLVVQTSLGWRLGTPSLLSTFLSVCKWSNGVLSWNHQLNNTLFSYKSFGPGEPRKFYKVGVGHVPQKWSETALPVEAYEYTLGINSTRQDFNCVFVYTLPRRGKGRNISLIIVGLSGRQAILT